MKSAGQTKQTQLKEFVNVTKTAYKINRTTTSSISSKYIPAKYLT